MTISLETELVRQCAPTLAGIKAASLFRFVFSAWDDPVTLLAGVKETLRAKQIRIQVLNVDIVRRAALLYVYRPKRLTALLQDKATYTFLQERGYRGTTYQEILEEVSLQLACRNQFPHEIGVLLDYPLEDVKAYIARPREKGVCSGCWKAYGNGEQASSYFAKCRTCTRIYWNCYWAGMPLSRLAVA